MALLAPDLSGHRAHWLQHVISDMNENGFYLRVYTLEANRRELLFSDSVFNDIDFKFSVDLAGLISCWRSEMLKEDLVGISFEADKILPNLLFAKGRMRLLIMRPYLEEKSFKGMIQAWDYRIGFHHMGLAR